MPNDIKIGLPFQDEPFNPEKPAERAPLKPEEDQEFKKILDKIDVKEKKQETLKKEKPYLSKEHKEHKESKGPNQPEQPVVQEGGVFVPISPTVYAGYPEIEEGRPLEGILSRTLEEWQFPEELIPQLPKDIEKLLAREGEGEAKPRLLGGEKEEAISPYDFYARQAKQGFMEGVGPGETLEPKIHFPKEGMPASDIQKEEFIEPGVFFPREGELPQPTILPREGELPQPTILQREGELPQPAILRENLQEPPILFPEEVEGKIIHPSIPQEGKIASGLTPPKEKEEETDIRITQETPSSLGLAEEWGVDKTKTSTSGFVTEKPESKITPLFQGFAPGSTTATSETTPPPAIDRPLLQEIIDKIVDKMYTLTVEGQGRTDTVITLKNPDLPLLDGVTITVSEFSTARGEFNITLANLTPEAQRLLDTQENRENLKLALEKEGYAVHIITMTTEAQSTTTIEGGSAQEGRREGEGEGESGGGRQERGREREGEAEE